MEVIARKCTLCNGGGRSYYNDGLGHRGFITCPTCGGEGEVVPASQLAGAVEECNRLREYIKLVLAEDLHSQADKRARSRLREALYLTGEHVE